MPDEQHVRQLTGYLEETFRVMADESPNMIFINQGGMVVYANKKCEEIMGYTREDLLSPGFDFFSLIAPEYHDKIREAFVLHRKGEDIPPYEYTLLTKDRARLDVIITSKLITYGEKPAILGIVTDITFQKHFQDALRDSEERYRATIDSLADAMHVVNRDLRIVLTNQALYRFNRDFGLPEVIVGKTVSEAYPFLGEKVRREYERVFSTGEALITEENTRLKGEEIFTETRKIPVVENGRVTKVITIIRNISDRKKTEQQLQTVNEELSKSNRKLKVMAFTDSHTGLYNHRFFGETLEHEFEKARKKKYPLSIIMLDIDYFKSVNDVYGHHFGDQVLHQFSQKLKKIGSKFTSVRYGGEEFIVMSPKADREETLNLAQRLLETLNVTTFGTKKNRIKLKLSIAVVSCPEDRASRAMDLIELAEQVLGKAKESGGNRVYSTENLKDAAPSSLKSEIKPNIRYLKEKIDRLNKRANQGLVEAVFAFAKTIEMKDHYTGEHVERTVAIATSLADEVGLTKAEIMLIRQAAILHDLGKVGVSEKILRKPSKLTPKEFREIKEHPVIGVDIIRPIHLLHDIVPLILYHHERWDGKGYPMGLKGEEIPIGARIITIADTYQALTSNRPYRKAFPKKKAIDMIRQGSGTQFDPRIVEAFLRIV